MERQATNAFKSLYFILERVEQQDRTGTVSKQKEELKTFDVLRHRKKILKKTAKIFAVYKSIPNFASEI